MSSAIYQAIPNVVGSENVNTQLHSMPYRVFLPIDTHEETRDVYTLAVNQAGSALAILRARFQQLGFPQDFGYRISFAEAELTTDGTRLSLPVTVLWVDPNTLLALRHALGS